jgi:hypothetical protein
MRVNHLPDPHLSPEQLSEWVLGERSNQVIRHVTSCATCQTQIKQFEEILGGFRASVREWSEEQLPSSSPVISSKIIPSRRGRPYAWAVTAVYVMAALVVVVLLRHGSMWQAFNSPPMATESAHVDMQPQVSAKEEAALFAQIDQEISRTVPAAMDPLSKLVAGDGARAKVTGKADMNARIQ